MSLDIKEDPVLEFINRRFKKDCNWLDGNCYYFAVILNDRFPGGRILYDVVNGHFIYCYLEKNYDWTGIVDCTGYLVDWVLFNEYDESQRNRIVECCLK